MIPDQQAAPANSTPGLFAGSRANKVLEECGEAVALAEEGF